MPKQSFSNILSLSAEEAMDFLLQSKHYHEFELPEYFDFDAVLQFVKEKIGNKSYAECCNDEKTGASAEKNVNFNLILNKDGKYGIRPLALCNPYLYYFLVREICSFENWNRIKEHFEVCSVPLIHTCAIRTPAWRRRIWPWCAGSVAQRCGSCGGVPVWRRPCCSLCRW